MSPVELGHALMRQPFQPFRLVLTDGAGYDIRHPDLLWIGQRSAMVGLTGEVGHALYERTVLVDLLHISRLKPLPLMPATGSDGQRA